MRPFYNIQIITPQGMQYTGKAVHSLIPAEDGFVGVLANHAPYVTSSPGGWFEVDEKDGAKKKFKVGVGFFEVAGNQATLLTQSLTAEE